MKKIKKNPPSRTSYHSNPEITHPVHSEFGLERLVFFSDAVMAIAITLLVIEIKVPEIAITPASTAASVHSEFVSHLMELFPRFMGFFLSFCVIGVYWMLHHRFFSFIKRYDYKLILLNLVFLLFIALMPFFSSLIGHHPLRITIVAYAAEVAALGLSMSALWWYASHNHRLVDPLLTRQSIRVMQVRVSTNPMIFLLSIPLALVFHPQWAIILWMVSPLIIVGVVRLAKHQKVEPN